MAMETWPSKEAAQLGLVFTSTACCSVDLPSSNGYRTDSIQNCECVMHAIFSCVVPPVNMSMKTDSGTGSGAVLPAGSKSIDTSSTPGRAVK